jgi:DNA topoisomerase-1
MSLLLKYYIYLQFGGKKKWTTFSHNGVSFPPKYIPHNIQVTYQGDKVTLTPEQEEIATLYAKYLNTEYFKSTVFNKNFWKDWKQILGTTHKIQSLMGCDFTAIHDYILKINEEKTLLSKDEKQKRKDKKDQAELIYKYAILDGKKQAVGNFRVEPPGIFIGRGCHPKLGKIKNRIYPEDVTLNMGNDAKIPDLPSELSSHKWGKVTHDKHAIWLASWKDGISGKTKYVWLGAQSDFKAQSDIDKFDLARKLKKKIGKIREQNEKDLSSNDITTKQIATALYFIDNLALRVGNEKGKDKADTFGVVSLRVEHLKLSDTQNRLTLNFLGKDSIRYVNTIIISDQIYKNIKEFMMDKEKGTDIFNKINSNDINKYLQTFMKGLTAKVFRTYNASNLFQKELNKISKKYANYSEDDKTNILLDEFNKANAKVAILCNHQKKVSKSFNSQIDKMNDMIIKEKKKIELIKKKNSKTATAKIDKIKKKIKNIKVRKALKIELKSVSLGTSKINYIDPRITVAFMKKYDVDINKLFSKTMLEQFKWAFEADANYKF